MERKNVDTLSFPFDSCEISNAIEIKNTPEAKKLHSFTEKEISDLEDFSWKIAGTENDSLLRILNAKLEKT